jgi:hypothetical protein
MNSPCVYAIPWHDYHRRPVQGGFAELVGGDLSEDVAPSTPQKPAAGG